VQTTGRDSLIVDQLATKFPVVLTQFFSLLYEQYVQILLTKWKFSLPQGKSISWVSLKSDVKVAQLIWEGKPVNVLSDIPNSGPICMLCDTY
jgi:hypothetical protein